MSELRQVALRDKAYELHYQLMQHYSSQIFRARIAITTVTLIIVAYALDVENENKPGAIAILGIEKRPIIAFLGATFIVFLCLMEVGYLKRFYQVVKATRILEKGKSLSRTYAAEYDPGEAKSILALYSFAVLLLLGVFIAGACSSYHTWRQFTLAVIPVLLPLAGGCYVFLKLKRASESLS